MENDWNCWLYKPCKVSEMDYPKTNTPKIGTSTKYISASVLYKLIEIYENRNKNQLEEDSLKMVWG